MLTHSFVLDALETTGADTFSHFEMLIDEHRRLGDSDNSNGGGDQPTSRLKTLVPTIGKFHTHLPLRKAFEAYNDKHRLTKRKHIQISFNEIRHIMNLAQCMALRTPLPEDGGCKDGRTLMDCLADASMSNLAMQNSGSDDEFLDEKHLEPGQLNGPKMITFDGDQTLYSDGSNFEDNPHLANYLFQLLRHGVHVAVVTAAGYEYNVEKYEHRLSGLLEYFRSKNMTEEECSRFYLFGGECNFLLHVSESASTVCIL